MKYLKWTLPFILLAAVGCKKDCIDADPACSLDPDPGLCQAAFKRYYYDAEAGECKEFIWGGCGGVVPFDSLEACRVCECEDN